MTLKQTETDENISTEPSKSQHKRDADAQQEIGRALTLLLELPESLHDAVVEYKRLTANGAIRRQLQYIGRLMRDIDTAPIADQLHRWQGKHTEENAYFHGLERWRQRLIEKPEAIADFLQTYPKVDIQQVRTLVRNAQKEQLANKPPKSSRELFKLIRETAEVKNTEVEIDD
jgi:ribosome-associated protein